MEEDEDIRDAKLSQANSLAAMLWVIETDALEAESRQDTPTDVCRHVKAGVLWALSDMLEEADKANQRISDRQVKQIMEGRRESGPDCGSDCLA
ncbi:MAG: hypothetical protein ACLFSI_08755 [Halorhodospira sp.]